MEACEESMGDGRDLCDTLDVGTGGNEIDGGDYGSNNVSRQTISARKAEGVRANKYDKYLPATKRRYRKTSGPSTLASSNRRWSHGTGAGNAEYLGEVGCLVLERWSLDDPVSPASKADSKIQSSRDSIMKEGGAFLFKQTYHHCSCDTASWMMA